MLVGIIDVFAKFISCAEIARMIETGTNILDQALHPALGILSGNISAGDTKMLFYPLQYRDKLVQAHSALFPVSQRIITPQAILINTYVHVFSRQVAQNRRDKLSQVLSFQLLPMDDLRK